MQDRREIGVKRRDSTHAKVQAATALVSKSEPAQRRLFRLNHLGGR